MVPGGRSGSENHPSPAPGGGRSAHHQGSAAPPAKPNVLGHYTARGYSAASSALSGGHRSIGSVPGVHSHGCTTPSASTADAGARRGNSHSAGGGRGHGAAGQPGHGAGRGGDAPATVLSAEGPSVKLKEAMKHAHSLGIKLGGSASGQQSSVAAGGGAGAGAAGGGNGAARPPARFANLLPIAEVLCLSVEVLKRMLSEVGTADIRVVH